jgi:hypothetical protein
MGLRLRTWPPPRCIRSARLAQEAEGAGGRLNKLSDEYEGAAERATLFV